MPSPALAHQPAIGRLLSLVAGLNGVVRMKGTDHALVAVGGVTFRVFLPAIDLAQVADGAPIGLHTHLVVREDDLQLYGFVDERALATFELLIGVNGVGPKVALALLSAMPADAVATAIAVGDADALARAPGIGKRTAERIIVELRPKMDLELAVVAVAGGRAVASGDPALDWLISLGFSAIEARQALSVEPQDELDTGERVRRALQRMGRDG